MTKDYQDLHSLDPQEEGGYRSGHSFPSSGFSFPAAPRSSKLLYGLFTLCAFLLSVLIIVIAVNNSNLKETQKKQEENLSNISLSVQSNYQSLRSDEGSMQERLISLEDAIKKLESDRSLETYQRDLQALRATVGMLRCDLQKLLNNESSSWCCPKDWMEFSGSCYFFSKVGRSWEESEKFCASENAHLVVINTTPEQEFVNQNTIPEYTWIGLTDTDGQWKWVDGTNYETTPKNWIPGQPDEYYGHGLGGGEDCAHLHRKGDWNDDHCSRKYNAVCEQKTN